MNPVVDWQIQVLMSAGTLMIFGGIIFLFITVHKSNVRARKRRLEKMAAGIKA